MRLRGAVCALAIGTVCVFAAASVDAQPSDLFYSGKQITMAIPGTPGGDYDTRSRLLARHLGRHIPGTPVIMQQSMPSAGGLQAANWLATLAPRDGTAFGIIIQSFPANQLLGGPGVRYDVRRFNWIGNITSSPNTISVWYLKGVDNIEHARSTEVVLGAAGTASPAIYYPRIMNSLLGTRFKVIPGYPGGNEINLAMERGEVDGRGSVSLASWLSSRPDWIREKKLRFIVQIGVRRSPQLAEVPLLIELATNASDRNVFKFLSADAEFARALVSPPETPRERVEILRRAFDATMKDPAYLKEAKKAGSDVEPMPGEYVQSVIADFMNTPEADVARAKILISAAMKQ